MHPSAIDSQVPNKENCEDSRGPSNFSNSGRPNCRCPAELVFNDATAPPRNPRPDREGRGRLGRPVARSPRLGQCRTVRMARKAQMQELERAKPSESYEVPVSGARMELEEGRVCIYIYTQYYTVLYIIYVYMYILYILLMYIIVYYSF